MRNRTLIALGAAATLVGARAPDPYVSLALTHVNLLDGVTDEVRRGITIIMRGGRIRNIQPATASLPRGVRALDLRGAWVMPGLIDTHAHLRNEASARRAVLSGVTTARVLGVDRYVDVAIARRHRGGDKGLPDVIGAGYHVRPRLAEAFFTDFPELAALREGLSSPGAVRMVVRANASRGVAVIKVMATERAGMPDTNFRRRALDDVGLAAAVAEAARLRLHVAAHAHTDAGAHAAVLAGVRSVEHGTAVSAQTLKLMRRRGVCLVPTLSFWNDMATPGGEYDNPLLAARGREMFPIARRTVAEARRLKVRIGAGSDMSYDRANSLTVVDEIHLLIESGLAPAAAMRSATSDAAACVGIGGRTGAVRRGLEADLLVLDGDPTRDLSTLKRPRIVINDGQIVAQASEVRR